MGRALCGWVCFCQAPLQPYVELTIAGLVWSGVPLFTELPRALIPGNPAYAFLELLLGQVVGLLVKAKINLKVDPLA